MEMSAATSPGLVTPDDRFAIITFIEEPPKHIFVEKWFDVGVLVTMHTMPKAQALGPLESTFTMQLKPHLYRYTQGETSSQPASQTDNVHLTMNPPFLSLCVSETGSPSEYIARAKCKISCSGVQSSKPLAFSIQFKAETEPTAVFDVKPTFSQPLSIVNAKLTVESPGWEDTWYKEMGGKDKAILCIASLLDKDGKMIKDRKVPLHLTLLYDDEQQTSVANQDIFRTIGSSCQCIDPETGTASLQFRIEDVSRNHQGRNFVIEISADKEKCPDVAPVYSRSVCVRSKKNVKRQRDDTSAPAPPPKHQASQPPLPPPLSRSPSADPLPFMMGSSHGTQQMREAMRGIIKWTEEVVNGLLPLKWNVIGYARNPDGVIDYNRPYHSMPNPNERIKQILDMYAEDTREHLLVLRNAVEQSTGTNNTEMNGNHPSSHFHPQTPFRPGMRQWQNTYQQDHPSYYTQGLASHEASPVSPYAMPNQGAGLSLQPVPMQNQYWMQHNTQGMQLPRQGVAMHREPDRTSQGEPDNDRQVN